MTEEIKQMERSTWDEIQVGQYEKKPQVKVLNIGKEHGQKVIMLSDRPREIKYMKDGVEKKFFIFDVSQDKELKDFPTSSIPLLKELKAHEPIGGKEFLIYKEMVEGRQWFKVELLSPTEVPVEEVKEN